MKITTPSAFRVMIELDPMEAAALQKLVLSADYRQLHLEWAQDAEEIDELAGALQVQLAAVLGP
jgi:hypothetical protein